MNFNALQTKTVLPAAATEIQIQFNTWGLTYSSITKTTSLLKTREEGLKKMYIFLLSILIIIGLREDADVIFFNLKTHQ